MSQEPMLRYIFSILLIEVTRIYFRDPSFHEPLTNTFGGLAPPNVVPDFFSSNLYLLCTNKVPSSNLNVCGFASDELGYLKYIFICSIMHITDGD